MGRPAAADGGSAADAANPDNRLDVFLEDLGDRGLLRLLRAPTTTTAATQVSAYCVLDDDFARAPVRRAPAQLAPRHRRPRVLPRDPVRLRRLRGHLVHGGLGDLGRGRRLRQHQRQLPVPRQQPDPHPRTSLDYSGGAYPYGSFIFFTYAPPSAATDGRAPVLGHAAVGVRTSLQAIRAVVGERMAGLLHHVRQLEHAAAAQLPGACRLPEPAWWLRRTLTAAGDHDRLAQRRSSRTSAAPPPWSRPGRDLPGPQAAAGQHRRPAESSGCRGPAPAALPQTAGDAHDDPARPNGNGSTLSSSTARRSARSSIVRRQHEPLRPSPPGFKVRASLR